MMLFRLSVGALAFALVALGTPVKRDAPEVLVDLKNIDTQVKALDTSITAFPDGGGTLAEVYAIHEDAVNLANSIKIATDDVTASPTFSDADAAALLGLVQKYLGPDVSKSLDDLAAKKAAVATIPYANEIAKSDVGALKSNMDSLGAELLDKTPADKQGVAQELINTMNAKFNYTINAFS